MITKSKATDVLLQRVVDEFSAATGLAAVIVDINGQEISRLCNFTQFCALMRAHQKHRLLCQKCALFGGLESVKSGACGIYRCHAGLVEFAMPIIAKDQLAGFFISGQVLCEDQAKFPAILEATNWQSYEALASVYRLLPVLSAKKIIASASVLEAIVGYYLKTQLEIAIKASKERHSATKAKPPEKRKEIKQALKYIDKNIHQPITLEAVSCHVFLSSFYFSKLFKKEMQVNFIDYVVAKKMTLAKEMLANTHFSIDKVAKNLGYAQTSYFCRVFKQQWQITPKNYRESLK